MYKELLLHSFEAGRKGKPDELDSQIAHLIGAYLLQKDNSARFDLRVVGGHRHNLDKLAVRISGEVSEHLVNDCKFNSDVSSIVIDHYNKINRASLGYDDFVFTFETKPQSHSLSQNGESGDSGNPIAVAYSNTPNQLPLERYIAVEIRNLIDTIYQNGGTVPSNLSTISGVKELKGLRADGKIGVDLYYDRTEVHSLPRITVAAEHESSLSIGELRDSLTILVQSYLNGLSESYKINFGNTSITVNGLGAWNSGGWKVDEGSREAKSYRDGFGTYGVMEDSFSGEDPTKPSGTGTFLARYIANLVVNRKFADFARVALTYEIGREDVGLNIFTNGTGTLPQTDLENLISGEVGGLRVKDAINLFNLRNPALYKQIAADSDFFHNPDLPWNRILHSKK